MPVVSKAQNAAMHAAAEGKSTLGIPKKVAKEFVNASAGENIKDLPQHSKKSKAASEGRISEKAAKRRGW